MTQEEFKRRHEPSWLQLESALATLAAPKGRRLVTASDVTDLADFDRLYRLVCKHLALARQRLYGTDLVGYLNDLALRGHRQFYGRRHPYWPAIARFILGDFPALVRAHAVAVWLSTALFVIPAAAMSVSLYVNPDLIHSVMGAEQIRQLEEMYEPGADYRSRDRAAESDMVMFGFYIMNNVGIGFKTFAGGIVFGLGSIFFVALNGLLLGAAAMHLHLLGYGETFFPFVAAHSAPELTAIVLSGAAGLTLGWSLIAPGRRTRGAALKRAATDSVGLVYGIAGMLLLAAFIEAFWSPRAGVPVGVKYLAGGLMWLATLSYFVFAGRSRGS